MFLEKWNNIKKKAEQIGTESSSSSSYNSDSDNERLEETNTLLSLNSNLEEQKLNQAGIQTIPRYRDEDLLFSPNGQENTFFSSSFVEIVEVVTVVVLFVTLLFMGRPNYNQNFNFHR